MEHVVGLDWMKGEWAACVLDLGAQPVAPAFRAIPEAALAEVAAVTGAKLIAVDVPIGLPEGEIGAALRGCDRGAKRILGRGASSVFPVPVRGELEEFRRRRRAGEKQQQGHARGLLPAIDSFDRAPAALRARALESHPEVAFAILAGGALPRAADKKSLLGQLVRLAVLQAHGVGVPLEELPALRPLDDYLDAAAMALVARAWVDGSRPAVGASGEIAPNVPSEPWTPFMALPAAPAPGFRTLTSEECVRLARSWTNARG